MPLVWQDSYRIGDAEIDAQHQRLIELANVFLNASSRDEKLLHAVALFRHTRDHFEYEEGLMRRISYPAIGDHFKEHTDLISELNRFSERIASDTLVNDDLQAFLSNWLLNHMITSDGELAVYLRS